MEKAIKYKPVPLKQDDYIVAWACGKCGRIDTEQAASKCCGASVCDCCGEVYDNYDCGEEYDAHCKPCNRKKIAEDLRDELIAREENAMGKCDCSEEQKNEKS